MGIRSAMLPMLVVVIVGACSDGPEPPLANADQLGMQADNIIIGLQHSITTDGMRRAHLVADSAYVAADSMEVVAPRMTFYGEYGQKTGDLVGKRGYVNMRSQLMTVVGSVVLNTAQGSRRIESEELRFDPEGNRVWSDKPTVMREGGTVVRGSGFTSDSKMENVRIRNPSGQGLRLRL